MSQKNREYRINTFTSVLENGSNAVEFMFSWGGVQPKSPTKPFKQECRNNKERRKDNTFPRHSEVNVNLCPKNLSACLPRLKGEGRGEVLSRREISIGGIV